MCTQYTPLDFSLWDRGFETWTELLMARFSSKLWVLTIKFDIVPHCVKRLKWSISKRHIYSLELCQRLTLVPGNPNCRRVGDSFHCFLTQSPFLSGHWEGSASSSAGSIFTAWFSLDNGVKKGAVDATQAPRSMLRNMLLLSLLYSDMWTRAWFILNPEVEMIREGLFVILGWAFTKRINLWLF